jgi:hypothetical protein
MFAEPAALAALSYPTVVPVEPLPLEHYQLWAADVAAGDWVLDRAAAEQAEIRLEISLELRQISQVEVPLAPQVLVPLVAQVLQVMEILLVQETVQQARQDICTKELFTVTLLAEVAEHLIKQLQEQFEAALVIAVSAAAVVGKV